jgi:hypothetical protein
LKHVQDAERQGRELAGAAMHLLALGNTAGAVSLLRRACVVHATQEVRLLSMIVTRTGPSSNELTETALYGTPPLDQDTHDVAAAKVDVAEAEAMQAR